MVVMPPMSSIGNNPIEGEIRILCITLPSLLTLSHTTTLQGRSGSQKLPSTIDQKQF